MANLEGPLPRRLKELEQRLSSLVAPCQECGSGGRGPVNIRVLREGEKAGDFPCPSCGKHPAYFTIVYEEKPSGGLE
jgi:hypothetical protein